MSTKKIKRMAGLTVLNLIFIIICLLALIPIQDTVLKEGTGCSRRFLF